MKKIDHLALYVTDLRRSMDFYERILHAHVYGPISPANLTFKGQITEKFLLNENRFISPILSYTSPRLMSDIQKKIAFIASNGVDYDILLVEKRNLKNDYVISVDGKTIYGFSYTLSSEVNMEILSWDLHNLDVSFEHGDSELDGTIYTNENKKHSLYIKDPDGRVIELKSGTEQSVNKPFIQHLDSVTLHVTSPLKSKNFYMDKFGLVAGDEITDYANKHLLWLINDNSKKIILLYGITGLDGEFIKPGGHGLDHIALSGILIKGNPNYNATDILMNPEKLKIKTNSHYLNDPDGYWIESVTN